MAVGDILAFGTLRWYTREGVYYDVKQVPSCYRTYPNYFSFKFVDTDDSSYKWEWIEAIIDGRKIYISKTIPFEFRTKILNDIKQTVTLNGKKYTLRLLTIHEFRNLPSSVLSQIDFNYSQPGYNTFYVATSTIKSFQGYSASRRIFIGMNASGQLYEVDKTDSEIDQEPSQNQNQFQNDQDKARLGYLPILEEVKNPPTISGTDTDLGKKSSSFSISYSVKTIDETDEAIITEKLNGNVIRTLKNPSQGYPLTFDITSDLFRSLNMNETNTIEITATNNEATSYRRYTFIKTNSGPTINYSGQSDLGELTSKPTISYSIHDNEGDQVIVKEKLNGVTYKTYEVTLGDTNTITFSDDFWITCNGSLNTLEIVATDAEGSSTSEIITFSRKVNKIQFTTKDPIETSTAASKIMVTPQWDITNATGKVEACNNGFDNSPTWEDITNMVTACRPYVFVNSTKTANKWGIKIRITITKNEGFDGEVAIYGFGGAYE